MVIAVMEPPAVVQDISYRRLERSGSGNHLVSSTALPRIREGPDGSEGVVGPNTTRNSNGVTTLTETEIPDRYLRGCQGDMVEATKRWKETLQWRAEQNVDQILVEKQPHFRLIKECYPHFLHRRDKHGHPIYYELLGKIDLKALKAAGVTIDEMLRYYIFLTEYIWSVVEPDFEYGALVSILDVEGVGLFDLKGDALEFLKGAAKVVQQHYVERSSRLFIVNAPSWFSMMWKIIAPMLNENTRKKISILSSKDQTKALLELIDPQSLPARYGGEDSLELGKSPEEMEFRQYADDVNDGKITTPPVPITTTIPPDPVVRLSRARSFGNKLGASAASLMNTIRRNSGNLGNIPTPTANTSSGQAEEEEPRLLVRWGQKLFTPLKNIFQHEAQPEPPQANLGHENKYVYDSELGQWVLHEDEDVVVVDESEERLIRAIQAAHGAPDNPEGTTPSATHRTLTTGAASPKLPAAAGLRNTHTFGSFLRVHNPSAVRRNRMCPAPHQWSRGASLLLLLLWRSLSIAILVVMPLWLSSSRPGALNLAAGWVGCLFSLSGVITLLIWAIFLYILVRPSSQFYRQDPLSPAASQRVFGFALLAMAVGLFLMSHGLSGKVPLVAVAVLTIAVEWVVVSVSYNWSVAIYATMYKKDRSCARYQLVPALQFMDVMGSFIGPSLYYCLDYRLKSRDAWSLSFLDLTALIGAFSTALFCALSFLWDRPSPYPSST